MQSAASPDTKFLTAPGELGGMIGAHDWGATPLGPIAEWPPSLKTAVSLMLSSRQPMWIGWGPAATFLYNDAYINVLGQAKHGWALGRPAQEVWAEIWHICGPLAAIVFEQGESTVTDDVRLFMRRGDFLEETYFSFSYSPIRDESGNVAGLFCPNLDITSKHLNARRLRTLSELATRSLTEKTVDGACASVMARLADNPDDVPFALLYLADADGKSARLAHSAQLPAGSAPTLQALDGAGAGPGGEGDFPIGAVLRSGAPQLVRLDDLPCLPYLPQGLAGQRLTQALVLPLQASGAHHMVGALVLGVSAARKLDDEYRSFFGLLATQAGNAIQNARAAEDERRRIDMLAEVDRAKTQFFSNVSHEFRTPLTLMLGPLEDALADDSASLDTVQQERLRLIQRNALRLQKLVNTLLEFSRVQAGRAQPALAATDLATLTADLASSFRPTIEKAGMRLVVECDAMPGPVYLDPAMWETIVLNLMSNAFKFTFAGTIAVRLRAVAGAVELSVSDSGVGIAADQLPRLFERFHRVADARSRTHEGSGIGLALVHDLVALHGGRIEVNSAIGNGASFRVTLPMGRAVAGGAITPSPTQADTNPAARAFLAEADGWSGDPAAAQPAGVVADADPNAHAIAIAGQARERILVADDNADMRDYLGRLLRPRWNVDVVGDGQSALDAVRRAAPDLIVSDVMMPRLDGFGLLAALRAGEQAGHGQPSQQGQHIPFILLSARAGEEARVDGLTAGADDYLAKPFSGRELIARIETLLLRQRIRRIESAAAQRVQTIFAQAPVAIAITRGPQHVYEQANALYQELVGKSNLLGRTVREALPSVDQEQLQLIDTVYASGQPYVGRSVRSDLMRGTPPRREQCYFDFVYQPLLDQAGRTEGLAMVVFEVTQLAKAKRAAESANRAKDEFLAMLGHELRNPLAPIVTAVQLMRMRGVTEAEKERAIIERQSRHLVALVDDLLDVSRVAQGKVSLHTQRVELSEVVARAIETASPLIEQKRHQLSVEVPASGACVAADPGRLAQVVANLLTNAAKYTEAGGRIRIVCERDGGELVLSVIDSGIGIEAAMLDTIFDMFVQERQALSRAQGGLGLGLAIARSMMLLHGGSVSAHSDGIGKGSTFRMRMPAAAAIAADGGPARLATPAAPDSAGALEILIVDDNEDSARMLGDVLALKGHQVALAFDAPSALRMTASRLPDVALLDIGLPGMDGYELGRLLRERAGRAPLRIIAITGYGQDADRERALESGFDLHFAKPVDLARLQAELNRSWR